MLNPFPSLLIFSFFAPTLLRVGAAVTLAYTARSIIRDRARLSDTRFPITGKPASWMLWLGAIIVLLNALALFVGFGTQWAAIVGALIALKLAWFAPELQALSRAASLLLVVICLSLLLSGAGGLAFDLPL